MKELKLFNRKGILTTDFKDCDILTTVFIEDVLDGNEKLPLGITPEHFLYGLKNARILKLRSDSEKKKECLKIARQLDYIDFAIEREYEKRLNKNAS